MAVTMISGAFSTSDAASGRVHVPWDDKVAKLQRRSPLLRLLQHNKTMKKGVSNSEFKWSEDRYKPDTDVTTSTVTAAATTVPVSDGTYWTVDDVGYVPRTGERFHVTAITSNNLTVTRSIGGTAASAMNSAEELVIMGGGREEGVDARTAKHTQKTVRTQYLQIISNTGEVTKTEEANRMNDEPELPYQVRKIGEEHMRDIEWFCWFGEGSKISGATNSKPQRLMYGIDETISTNSHTIAAPGYLTKEEFDDFLRTGFTYGSDEKMLFGSGLVVQAISDFASDAIKVSPLSKKYGIHIKWYIAGNGGIVHIVEHPLFTGELAKRAYLLDFGDGCVKFRYLNGNGKNRNTKLRMNIQNEKSDEVLFEWLSECAIQLKQEERHAKLNGVTA